MDVTSTHDNNQVRFTVKGVVDEQGAEKLKAAFAAVAVKPGSEVVLDCREMTMIGSAGIGKLLLLYKRLAAQGVQLKVINCITNLLSKQNDMG